MTSSPRTDDDETTAPPDSPQEEVTTVGPLAETPALDAALGFGALDEQPGTTREAPVGSRAGAPTHAVLAKPRPMSAVAPPVRPAAPRPGPATTPRPLIRPAPRSPSEAVRAVPEPVSRTPRSLDRPIVHPLAGARPSSSQVAPPAPPPLQERALVEPPRLAAREDPREREIRARTEGAASVTMTAMRPSVSQILPKVSVITLVLLFQAVALPTAAGAPWELLMRPAEVTLQALAAFLLVGVVHLLTCRERTRGVLGVLLGALLLPFAFVAWRVAISAGVFDAQPALTAFFAGPLPTPAVPALLALVLVPAALFARGSHAPRLAVWGLIGAGLGAASLAGVVMSLPALFGSLSEAAFLGDRVAAWATLPLFVAVLLGALAVAWSPLGRRATAFGFLAWGAALVPLVVLALFAAKSDQWLQVLEPVKLVTFLGAITIYTSAALATAVNPRVREV